MSVDSDGKESFFATVGKSQDIQKKRIEKKAVPITVFHPGLRRIRNVYWEQE